MLFHVIASTACVTLLGIIPGHAQMRGAVHPLTAEQERALKPPDSFKECDKCPEMLAVPAGSFTMGSPASEDGHQSHESPQHPVTFARQFAVGRFAVTFDEWDACIADGGCNNHKPSEAGWGRGRQPVINVSWDDAKAYVAWLTRKTGKNYRLLSEAEREYVTRAGTTTPFWWGNSISTSQANYDGRFNYGGGAKGESRRRTLPADSFQPNPWGLFQVHGNVWTWVEDCWHESYEGAPADGSAWTAGDCSRRVIRGGSYGSHPRFLRSANRIWFPSGHRDFILGFWVGRTLTLESLPLYPPGPRDEAPWSRYRRCDRRFVLIRSGSRSNHARSLRRPGRPLNLDQKAPLQRGQLWNGFAEAKPPLASRAEQRFLFVFDQ